ncbi:MAG: hypothetical protein WDN02_12810 [Methylovirgula sp.]|uniref:hypothetical protein n=1 Tax=Methylovirgula sp. TaxID=1978224 RepID=UPI003076872C
MNDYVPPPEFMPSEAGWGCTFVGFEEREFTKRIAESVHGIIWALLEVGYDLSRLEGITVSARYAESLAELDRGFETSAPLAPTQEYGTGMAMAAPIVREGKIMSRLMLDASIGVALLSEIEQERSFGLCTAVHELAHVFDLANKDKAFPGVLLKPYPGPILEVEMFKLSSLAWDEYFTTEQSARLRPASLDDCDEVLETALDDLLARLAEARRAFFTHRDFGRVFREMSTTMQILLKFSAYVLGTLDGLGRGDEYGPKSGDKIRASRFQTTFDSLRQALRQMASTYPTWQGVEAFAPLRAVAQRALEAEGLHLAMTDDGQMNIWVLHPENFTPQQHMAASLGQPI